MRKNIFTLLVGLVVFLSVSACSCVEYIFFCESVSDNSHVVRGEILNKYEVQGSSSFDITYYMDVLITENILGNLNVDTLSIVNHGTSCDLFHDSFQAGDQVILNSIDETKIDSYTGFPYLSPGDCSCSLLRLENQIVQGPIRSDLQSQSYESFKSEIGTCTQLTALSRWMNDINASLYTFPNPSVEHIFITSSFFLEIIGSYELYSTTGQLMQNGLVNLNNQLRIEMENYPTGIYYLKINIEDQFITRKIIKN